MKFSIREFIIGVKGGNFFISIPMDSNIISKRLLNTGSLSWIR